MPFSSETLTGSFRSLVVLGCLFFFAGCSKPIDKEKPQDLAVVKGKVTKADNTPMTGGFVEFRPEGSDGNTTTNSTINPDGTYELGTFTSGDRHPGAPPGRYKVTILPDIGTNPEQQHQGQPIHLSEVVEVKAGQENEIPIAIPAQ